MKRSVVLGQLVPIPVGHRVAVALIDEDTAYVRDLETGIEHVPFRMVSKVPDNSYFVPRLYVEEIDPAWFEGRETIQGRVTACRVATMAVSGCDTGLATRLVIELDE